jgi:cytochrome P450
MNALTGINSMVASSRASMVRPRTLQAKNLFLRRQLAQNQLRKDPSLIAQFLEEALRLEGSTKQTARLARRDTRIGDLRIPAGTRLQS